MPNKNVFWIGNPRLALGIPLLSLALAACGSSGSGDKPAMPPDPESTQVLATVPTNALGNIVERLVFKTAAAEDPKCQEGAEAVSFWIDQDQDKQYNPDIDQGFQETILCKDSGSAVRLEQSQTNTQGRAEMAEFPELWLNFELSQATPALCPNGGFEVRFWIEAKAAPEANSIEPKQSISLPVCSGKDGKPGLDGRSSLLKTERLTQSAACPGQATKIVTFVDLNSDQIFDAAIDESYTENIVCDGKDGLSKALNTKMLNPGKKCPNGGLEIQLWTDRDENKQYEQAADSDYEERLVCHGKNGKDGKNGKNGKNGIDGQNGFSSVIRTIPSIDVAACQGPGYQVLTFTDHNANGEFDENTDSGYAENHICHGKNGISAAFSIESLDFAETCQAPGILLKTWSDVDGDQTYSEGKDAGYNEQMICHGKDYRNDFLGTFFSGTEWIKFDLQHFARLQQLEDGATVATYGKFAHYKMSLENILVFEPEFHECKDTQQQKIVQMTHAEFLEQLQSVFQGRKDQLAAELSKALDQSSMTAQKISSLEVERKKAQTEREAAQIGIAKTTADLSETKNQRDVTQGMLLELDGKIERQQLLVTEQAVVATTQQEILAKLDAQKLTLSRDVQSHRTNVASKQRNVDDLRNRLESSETDLQAKNQQFKLLTDEISQLNADISYISQEMKKPFLGLFPYLALEDRLNAQTKVLASKNEKKKDLTTTVAKAQKQVQSLKEEIAAAVADLDADRHRLNDLEGVLKQVTGDAAQQAKLASEVQNNLQGHRQSLADLHIVKKSLEEKTKELATNLDLLTTDRADFESSLKKWQDVVQKVEQGLGEERLSALASERESTQLEQKIAALNQRYEVQTKAQKVGYEIASDGNLLLCGAGCDGNPVAFDRGSEHLLWPEVSSTCDDYISSLLVHNP